jgi:hypothetical protein
MKFDKKFIFENVNQWNEFCVYANKYYKWSNPLWKNNLFATENFYEFRKQTDVRLNTEYSVPHLFIGIKDNKVYVFAYRTPTTEELKKYIWK